MKMLQQAMAIFSVAISIVICKHAYAAIDPQSLQQQRIDTLKMYVQLLGQGDYKQIPDLFTKHAVAVSSSGASDNINHFYETLFLKTISSPQSRLINIFDGQLKNNMMTVYYNLSWVGGNGVLTSQRFLDLFVFQADSTKIKTVYVFSNRFHESI